MKYDQIITYLQTEIDNKHLHSGDKIPSIRDMTLRFQCSKATVLRAYSELEAKHVVYSVPKSGYFIINSRHPSSSSAPYIDFASMMPDPAAIPYSEFRHCMNQALDVYQEKALMDNEKQGLPDLRTALAKQFQAAQIFERPENIYITGGAQQTIDILVRMPFPNGKSTVLVEQPTYAGILNSLRISGITAIGIARNYNGIDFDKLENYFKNGNLKFFYTMPCYQNPIGTSYSRKEKNLILDLARKYDVYIVEDDYLAEFKSDSKEDPLYAMDDSQHVIYIKSYSKVCLPGLRIGAVLMPQAFRNVFLEYKACVDPYTSPVIQGAFTMFVKNGMLDRHIKQIRQFFNQRISALIKACRQFPPEIIWKHFGCNAFIYLALPDKVPVSRLIASLQNKNILTQGGKLWYLPHFEEKNGIRICVYRANEDQIDTGISIINNEISHWLKQKADRITESPW